MADLGAYIARILRQKDAGVIDGAQALRRILEQTRRQVIDELGHQAVSGWDEYRLKQMLDAVERRLAQYETLAKAEIEKQINAMWDLGQRSVYGTLNEAGLYSGFDLSTSVLNTLRDFTFHKIEGLSASAWDRVRSELTMGVLGGRTPHEVAQAIGTNLTDPSVFGTIDARAEVITKTELGRVYSTAAQKRLEQAAAAVPGLKKVWVHAGHPRRPRITHLAADGQVRDVDEPFIIGGQPMMYPRDPAAPIEEVINCGCDHVAWKEEWGQAPAREAA